MIGKADERLDLLSGSKHQEQVHSKPQDDSGLGSGELLECI